MQPSPSAARNIANQGPGQSKLAGSAIGMSPSPRCASQLRHTVHGWGWRSSGTGTSATSSSRIDASDAATDRCIEAPDVGVLTVRIDAVLARRGLVQADGSSNQGHEGLLVDLIALVEVDGAPGVASEAGVEQSRRVF